MSSPEQPIFYGDYSFNTGVVKTFGPLDYVIFSAILVISAVIGFYHAWKDRNKKTLTNYLLAGRQMSPVPVGLSMLASFMSAITLLGAPAEIYNYTLVYWWTCVSSFLIFGAAAHIYIPVFYNLGVTSAFEYLERRFDKKVRTAGSCAMVLQMTLYMAIVLYAPSVALEKVTGLDLWVSIASVGVVCTAYTAVGGMKAVLWTDSFQVGMMVIGLLAILIQGADVVGGFGPAWDSAVRAGRDELNNWSLDPSTRHTVWGLVIGAYFTWGALFCVNQTQVQRAMSCPTLRDAQIAMWLACPGFIAIIGICILIGFFMSAFYEKCDPLSAGLVSHTNQLVPLFVMDVLSHVHGIPGLFVACLFSGSLSTLSSGLNAIAAVIVEDVVKGYIRPDISEPRAQRASQIIALVFGLACIGMTPVIHQLGSGILQISLSMHGAIGGSLLGLFTLGMFFPWANARGAIVGLFSGLVFVMWIVVGALAYDPPNKTSKRSTANCNRTVFDNSTFAMGQAPFISLHHIRKEEVGLGQASLSADNAETEARSWDYPLYTVSYCWHGAIAVMTVLIVGMLVSAITRFDKPSSLDPRLIYSIPDHVFPLNFLPESVKKPLRFGVRHGSAEMNETSQPEVDNNGDDAVLEENSASPSPQKNEMESNKENPETVNSDIVNYPESDIRSTYIR